MRVRAVGMIRCSSYVRAFNKCAKVWLSGPRCRRLVEMELLCALTIARSQLLSYFVFFFFFQAEDGIRDDLVTGVQTCALPILAASCARRKRAAATNFIARVICWVFFTERIRRRKSRSVAMLRCCDPLCVSGYLGDSHVFRCQNGGMNQPLHKSKPTANNNSWKDYTGLVSAGAKRSLKLSTAFLISVLIASSSAFFSLMPFKMPGWLVSTNCRNSFSKRRTSPTGMVSINPLVAMNRLSTCFSTEKGAY